MKKPELAPHEQSALDKKREGQRSKQPYASEVDDRELERAHKRAVLSIRIAKSNPNAATNPGR